MTSAWFEWLVPVTAAVLQTVCALHVGVPLRDAPGARAFAFALGCEAWWAAGYVVELFARGTSAKVFWDNVQLPPAFLLPFAFLWFAREVSGRASARPARMATALLAVPPLLATLWVFSDPIHGQARASAHVVPTPPFDSLTYDFSLIERIAYFECVLIMAYVSGLLFVHAYRHGPLQRRQAFVVWLGSLLALVAELPGLGLGLEVAVLGQRDSSPVWFGLSGLVITYGLGRYRLFNLLPIAREAVFEQMVDPVLVFDLHDRLVDANPAARRLFAAPGHTPADAPPTSLELGQPLARALSAWPALASALLSPDTLRKDVLSPRGQAYELRTAQLRSGGRPCGRAVVLRDVTARTEASAELERRVAERTADLSAQIEATREAHEMRQKLEAQLHAAQRLESIGRLAGGVAHDFNNLLTVILGNAQLARMLARGQARLEEVLDGIERAGTSAADLTRQLLAFARQNVSELRAVVFNRTLESARSLIERLLGEDVKLHLSLAPDLWAARLDPSHAEQVLINLVVNARDAMPRGGGLFVSTENVHFAEAHTEPATGREHRGDYVLLRVRDEGIGMSPEVLARVFEPFFTTKPSGAGTGLGLSMVYGAVQRAGGFIEVESAPGWGTTFSVYVPRGDSAAAGERARDLRHPLGAGETVALVEDQPLVLATVKLQLEGLGYRVRAFASAEEARAGLSGHLREVDLLLTDVVLAGESGRELAERLAAERPGLPVVFMSGYTEDVVLRHGLERGHVRFLEKPFAVGQLAQTLRAALETGARQGNHP